MDRNDLGWVLAPLLDAGLSVDQARDLLFRLAFEEMVSQVRGTRGPTPDAVADQPDGVRAAWQQMLLRLMLLDPLREDGADGGLAAAEG
ncbi:hypothetical protein A7K94_0209520 [Modestobacter sp. VKM Ac-2676]|nr:hypothetical protein A7K94_0209520 [Modestobacter sp. VKM Ac-2676]